MKTAATTSITKNVDIISDDRQMNEMEKRNSHVRHRRNGYIEIRWSVPIDTDYSIHSPFGGESLSLTLIP